MEKKSIFRLFLSWLKARMKAIILAVWSLFVCWLVTKLYHLPLESGYDMMKLIGFAFLAAGVMDYYYFIKKYHQLLSLSCNSENIRENMPDSRHLIEESYGKIIRQLDEEKRRIQRDVDRQKEEMNDYYTLWAHQIKTPISAMHLLMEELPQEEKSDIEMELFKVEQYVEMVLQYLRLESISQDMLLKEYDLYELVKESVKKLSKSFIGRRIMLDLPEFKAEVITDKKWLSFVICQILGNSLKYTAKGGKISISFRNVAKEQIRILEIRDNGIGISPQDLPRIFERGFTGYNGRMDKKSTGIGLYLCKKVTSKLSHTLEVRSEPGHGTVVSIGFIENRD